LEEYISQLIATQEESTKLSYLVPSGNDLILIYLHLDREFLTGNNDKRLVSEAREDEGYVEYFKYKIGQQFFSPASEPLTLRKSTELNWKGDKLMKPDINRCFQLNLRFRNKQDDSLELGHETLCFFGTPDGSDPIDIYDARIQVDQWAQKINRVDFHANLEKAQEYIVACTDLECIKTLTCDNPIVAPIEKYIYTNAVRIENVCRALSFNKIMNMDKCQSLKQDDIVFNIEHAC